MAKILVRLQDENVDLEEFILIHEEDDLDEVKALLDEYRKSDEEYDIDGFLAILDENDIEYEQIAVESIYF